MNKWYKQPYFDRRVWLLENFDKLNLSNDELVAVLLIDYCRQFNIEINYEYLSNKLHLDVKDVDKILLSLTSKKYLSIKTENGEISFDIENIFEFDPGIIETIDNQNIYDLVSDFLSRPLIPDEMMKTNELIDKYGENRLNDALRIACAYHKYSLAYVEAVLKNENKQ